MKSIELREQQRYDVNELASLFSLDGIYLTKILKRLKDFGILKSVKKKLHNKELTELLESDIELEEADGNDQDSYFVFTFVGVVMLENFVLHCYPKYMFEKRLLNLSKLFKVLIKSPKGNRK